MTLIADPFEAFDEIPAAPAPAAPAPAGPRYPASPAAQKYAVDLMVQKLGVERDEAAAKVAAMESREVSQLIDQLRFLPNKPKPPAPGEVTEDGMYRNPGTGDIFKVQKAVHGSGNLYAKRLVVDQAWERDADGTVLVEGETHFEYAPGALKTLKAEWRMTLEDAKEFGELYGVCMDCGTKLTNEKSIARKIGPWCARKKHWG
jgi:hypothetical protein